VGTVTEPGSTADGRPASGPGQPRGPGGSAAYLGPPGSPLSDPAGCEGPYDDDPSGGLRDQLSADELGWLRDPGEDPDGPDPDLYPDAYPDLDGLTAPSGGGRARVLVSALKPGSTLAGLLEHCVPDQMEDGPLAESLPAWRRIASFAAAGELAAIAELARRRVPRLWDHPDQPDDTLAIGAEPVTVCREVIEEIALALTLTHWSADNQAHLAVSLAQRLPATLAALAAGRIDLPRARLIDDATAVLTDEDAQRVEARILPRASRMTTGELRDALRHAVINIDPAAAEKRRRRAERHARVRLYGDSDHTATLAGEKLPAASAAAAYARIAAIAAAMKAAGLPGSAELLQSQVFAGLLLGTLPHVPPPRPDPDDAGPDGAGPDGAGPAGPGPDSPGPEEDGPEQDGPEEAGPEDASPDGGGPTDADPGPGARPNDNGGPSGGLSHHGGADGSGAPGTGQGDRPGPGSGSTVSPSGRPLLPVPGEPAAAGCAEVPAAFRSPAGRLQLSVPWRTLVGLIPEPGRLCWLGPVTPQTAREIAAAGAADPACLWKVIITDDEGRALAVTRLRRRRVAPAARSRPWCPGLGPGQPGLVKAVTLTLPYALIGVFSEDVRGRVRRFMRTAGMSHLTGAESLEDVLIAAIKAAAAKIAVDGTAMAGRPPPGTADGTSGTGPESCPHTDEVPRYRVPGKMRDFLQARDVTCRFPVCRQPACHSDADHTIPYDRGGRTCRCNLGHTCRTHHQLKQLPGWTLEQPSPGAFLWRTPSGVSYAVTPDRHPA
jgi:hypothetical protein